MITDEIKEEVKLTADLVEVISDRVKLKRSGNGFTGLCPFHNEKSPSFHVSPHLGIYKCFGCGRAGDVFSFVMEQEGVDFLEAVRLLANRYNIIIPEGNANDDPNRHEREGVFHALKFATAFYHQHLREADEAKEARAYLIKRGLKRDFIKEYLLGYSPESWRGLAYAAKSAGISDEYLFKAGLLKESDTGREPYDTFRGRVMFPVINTMGRVIAFGGRLMGDVKAAKYINSPQTLVYNKSEALYGINIAKNEIRKQEEVIMVEGYMDVLQLHQVGIKNVVSTSGTAFTPQQVSILHRYAERLILIFDADNAGQSAMSRALPIALDEGLSVKVLTLPNGEDPDTFVKQFGKEGFLGFKNQHTADFLEFLIEGEKKHDTWDDPRHKKQVVARAISLIAMVIDPIEREAMIQKLHQLTSIGDRTLFQELNQLVAAKARKEKVDRKTLNYSNSTKSFPPRQDHYDQKVENSTPPRNQANFTPPKEEIKAKPIELKDEPFIQIPNLPEPPPISAEVVPQKSNDVPSWLNEEIPIASDEWEVSCTPFPDVWDKPMRSEVPKKTQNSSKTQLVVQVAPTIDNSIPAPRFEEELIKLMLIHGERMIAFIGEHCHDVYFESEMCKQLFIDLKTRFIDKQDISITYYMTREHPYPMWVGEILIDRHVISEKGQEMLKANQDEVLGPYRKAKSALKSIELNFCKRRSDELDFEIKTSTDEELVAERKKELSEIIRYKSKILPASTEKLYPNPPWLQI
ncbi:MAG: DNA primase [Bacteroidetes bacterium]|nr:DNA primase [Bacteroidota bacterium]